MAPASALYGGGGWGGVVGGFSGGEPGVDRCAPVAGDGADLDVGESFGVSPAFDGGGADSKVGGALLLVHHVWGGMGCHGVPWYARVATLTTPDPGRGDARRAEGCTTGVEPGDHYVGAARMDGHHYLDACISW